MVCTHSTTQTQSQFAILQPYSEALKCQLSSMAPSLRDHASFVRPSTRERPGTREQVDSSLVIPSRTSSLHSRITQPVPATLNIKPAQRTPKTLTHAYMVCGVGREPGQWVKAPVPSQGNITHMKGAVKQFWLPEILGSSPRLETDNEIARALHSAMRVSLLFHHLPYPALQHSPFIACSEAQDTHHIRPVSHTMSKSAQVETSHTACTTHSSSNKTHHIHSMA